MSEEIIKVKCARCPELFVGNENKIYCSDKCRNIVNNARRKAENLQIGGIITKLKTNRRIIQELLDDKEIKNVPAQRLLDKGFVFNYHTHIRTNKGDSKEYIFCFDYGYLALPSGWYKILKAFKNDE